MFFKLLNPKSNFQKSFALLLLAIPLCIPDAFAHRGRGDCEDRRITSVRRVRSGATPVVNRRPDLRTSIVKRRVALTPAPTTDRFVCRRPERIVTSRPTTVVHRRVFIRPAPPPPVVIVTSPPVPAVVTRRPLRQGAIIRAQAAPAPVCCMPVTWPESPFAMRRVDPCMPTTWPVSPMRVRRVMTNPDPWPISPFPMKTTWPGSPMLMRAHWVHMAQPPAQCLRPMPMAMGGWGPPRMAYRTY
jgi:hypothetical protein